MDVKLRLGIFEGFGIEQEYMLVDRQNLNVLAISDQILGELAGSIQNEVLRGRVAWSNELVMHVLEIKTAGTTSDLGQAQADVHHEVLELDRVLERHNAMLMPTAMHPWMNPDHEAKLWCHDNNEIYDAYHRIFDCRGHGWSNLQSVHINMPFGNDQEFVDLHTAIRLVLPLIPALAASSPFYDGRHHRLLDQRLDFYLNNQKKIPSITGDVIPEPIRSVKEYMAMLDGIYADIAPHDPQSLLQEEWLNSRGAIARFDRHAIEIRVMDVQECPMADFAMVTAVIEVVRSLAEHRWSEFGAQIAVNTQDLKAIFMGGCREGLDLVVSNASWLRCFGISKTSISIRELWQILLGEVEGAALMRPEFVQCLQTILKQGNLAQRLLRHLGAEPELAKLKDVYSQLARCLVANRLYGL